MPKPVEQNSAMEHNPDRETAGDNNKAAEARKDKKVEEDDSNYKEEA